MLHRGKSNIARQCVFLLLEWRCRMIGKVPATICHVIALRCQCQLYLSKSAVVIAISRCVGEHVVVRSLLDRRLNCFCDSVGVVKSFAAGIRGNLVHRALIANLVLQGLVGVLHHRIRRLCIGCGISQGSAASAAWDWRQRARSGSSGIQLLEAANSDCVISPLTSTGYTATC